MPAVRAALLSCVLFAPGASLAAAQDKPPPIKERPRKDEPVQAEEGEKNFYGSMRHLLDAVAGESDTPVEDADNRVRGLDLFLRGLERALNCRDLPFNARPENCNDYPRNNIFENAEQARGTAQTAYEKLRVAVNDVEAAHAKLKGNQSRFRGLMKETKGFKELLAQAVEQLRSGGGDPAQTVQPIRALDADYAAVRENGLAAWESLEKAELENIEARRLLGELEDQAVKAKTFDAKAMRSLDGPQSSQGRQGGRPLPESSERAVRNAHEALGEALRYTFMVASHWRSMITTCGRPVMEAALEENRLTLAAKEAVLAAQKDPALVEQAGQAAQQAAAAWDATFQAAVRYYFSYKEGESNLGVRRKISEIPDIELKVPRPADVKRLTSENGGKGSKALTAPKVLELEKPPKAIDFDLGLPASSVR